MYNPSNPIIVQSDKSILVEVNNPLYEQVRDVISKFAELEKSPEYIHTYKISPFSLWNASSSGMSIKEIKDFLEEFSKYELPQNVIIDIEDNIGKYGKIKLISENGDLVLFSEDKYLINEILSNKSLQKFITGCRNDGQLIIDQMYRGEIKHNLIKIGFPVEDLAGYVDGKYFEINLKPITSTGNKLNLRDYQREACDIFYSNGSVKGGSGVIVLPCGAGKTITAMAVMEKLKTQTLIITTNITALRQWKSELIDKTDILPELIGEYSGEIKEVKLITITTYQILTYRKNKDACFQHFELFNKNDWGFIIYDEVHLLPAPVFRITSQIQATRPLGLTATLVREDNVFSLIGPKKYDVPWKVLEGKGWIASAKCFEIREQMPENLKMKYAVSPIRDKFRIASENFPKNDVIDSLLQKHKNDNVLIIGQYIEQLEAISHRTNIPLITGKTPNEERIRLYDDFKKGIIKTLIVSKVANFAIDLQDANVAIQISGTFGSRQEEAKRLGRILRPKAGENVSFFYSVVTKDSREQEFAANRQLFLTEQGYKYFIRDFNDGWEN